ncbi:MAG TPA: hypothetical protein VIG06_30830 [Kofleriaceae bacterium]
MRSPLLAVVLALGGCLSSPPSGSSGPGDGGGDDGGPAGRLTSIAFQPGGQLSDLLYEHADGRQGTILLWIELGPDLDALADPVDIAHLSGFTISLDPGRQVVIARLDGAAPADDLEVQVPAFGPETSHLVSLRWDSTQVLGDLRHASLRVDDGTAVYGLSDAFAPALGSEDEQLITGGASADDGPIVIRSAFVLRRPIRDDDPPSGVAIGIGDEHEAIFAAGVDGDPTQVFGSWDVVFGLSRHGDPSSQEPFRGWSHPAADSLLGPGGFMLSGDDDPTVDGWRLVDESGMLGGELGIATGASGTFNGGYRVENASLQRTFISGDDVAVGDELLLRVVVYAGPGATGARAKVCLGPAASACDNAVFGLESSSRLLPDVILVGWTVDEQDIEVRLSMDDSDGSATRPSLIYSQAELYSNLLVDPGFESVPGPVLPEGWTASETLEDLELEQSAGGARSGALGVAITSGAPADEVPDAVVQEPAGLADLELYLVGGFFRRAGDDPAGISVTDGSMFRHDSDFREEEKLVVPDPGSSGVWHHRFAVGKRLAGEDRTDAIRWGGTEPLELTDTALDDTYLIRLSPVDLAFTYEPR